MIVFPVSNTSDIERLFGNECASMNANAGVDLPVHSMPSPLSTPGLPFAHARFRSSETSDSRIRGSCCGATNSRDGLRALDRRYGLLKAKGRPRLWFEGSEVVLATRLTQQKFLLGFWVPIDCPEQPSCLSHGDRVTNARVSILEVRDCFITVKIKCSM